MRKVKDLVLCVPVRTCLPEKYFFLVYAGGSFFNSEYSTRARTPPVGILLRALVTLRCLPPVRRCPHKTFNPLSSGTTQGMHRREGSYQGAG